MKKCKTTKRKLRLSKDTVRQLSKAQLGVVAGGPAKPTYGGCFSQ